MAATFLNGCSFNEELPCTMVSVYPKCAPWPTAVVAVPNGCPLSCLSMGMVTAIIIVVFWTPPHSPCTPSPHQHRGCREGQNRKVGESGPHCSLGCIKWPWAFPYMYGAPAASMVSFDHLLRHLILATSPTLPRGGWCRDGWGGGVKKVPTMEPVTLSSLRQLNGHPVSASATVVGH